MRSNYSRFFLVMIVLIFIALAGLAIYNLRTYRADAVSNAEALAERSLDYEATKVESYLQKGLDVLWVTADTVNFMMDGGASNGDILRYLVTETTDEHSQVDESFTGMYGWIRGEYLDGLGWEPPADFVATSRDWYLAGLSGGGEAVIVPPYLDAKDNTVMISVAQLLADGESVLSQDITLAEIQEITRHISLGSYGYAFIMDDAGMIVAHQDEGEIGKIYAGDGRFGALAQEILAHPEGRFQAEIEGETCSVFVSTVMDSWHVVMVASSTRLFQSINHSLYIQGTVSFCVFCLIFIFCLLAYRRIDQYRRSDEGSRERLQKLNSDIVKALAYTIDAKDRYTSGHSQRVANYSREIARRVGKSEEEQETIYYAGLLHDVGKIRVPEDVIAKPGGLDEGEFNQIKIHTVSGFHILKDIYTEPHIPEGAKSHHERYDGKGYPDGLAGENIPEVSRIIGVADAYDAMASNRSYRDALPQATVRREIEKGKGSQFDPRFADVMLQMIDEDKGYEMRQIQEDIKNILIVDDDRHTVQFVEEVLSEEPAYHSFAAASYAEAAVFLEKQKFDLILMGLSLPDMDGYEAFRKIRESYAVPIAFMTGEKNLDYIRKAGAMGAEDYITKPFLPVVLKERVHGILYRL